ncbi:M20 family metallopeptidase [Caballeronia ptereochthonis]|uniref:Acetylornithine deacetylase n=1 Tax=Caballeronia ptereochthonis TaxID=1777144 RepID=A0A158CDR8_9BURK|nr:M20 family metallopeptidase [Caballeronia ptereochthonis]SAK80523.1 acetylornithine deacetylase [Caballeronia ptereochthonis]
MTFLDPVALTRELVAFQSVNPPGDEEACARHLAGLLARIGFEVTLHGFGERRFNLVARLAGTAVGSPLGFTGHLDVVPLGSAPWAHDPFAGEIDNGLLYGRGASDMKAGIAAFVAACAGSIDTLRRGSGVHLILTGGEETGCDGAQALSSDRPELLQSLGALIVGEPSANRVLFGHKGALWLRGVARGVTAHGAMPDQGVNAIRIASDALAKLWDFEVGPAHEAMGTPTLNVGTIRGGLNINSVPDHTEFTVDIRTVPGIEHGSVCSHLRNRLGAIDLSPIIDLPPVYSEPSDNWIARVMELARPFDDAPSAPRTARFFTDAAVLKPATAWPPTIILGPGEPDLAHKTDEYCRVDRLRAAVELYRAILDDWVTRS